MRIIHQFELLKSHLFSDHAFCKFFTVGGKLSINILSNSNCIYDEKSLLVPTGQCSNRFEPWTEISFFFFFSRLAETEKKKVETKKGEQEEKIVTGKQQSVESCAAYFSYSTFDFHCGIKLVSFKSASAFADQLQSSYQLQISFSLQIIFKSASVNFSLQISFNFFRIAGSVMLKNEKFQMQQMKLKRWGSSEKGVELGFGSRNEKALLMEREWSGGLEQGLGQN